MNRFLRTHRRRVPVGCLAASLLAGVTGCLGGAELEPYPARVARPQPGEVVVVEDSVLVVDASGSIDRKLDFPFEKAVVRSFVDGMPPGTYRSALRVLGGRDDDQLELEAFDRFELKRRAAELAWTGRETPLGEILDDYRERLAERTGRAAFVIFSDGVPTRYGRYAGVDDTLESARQIVSRHPGEVCFHTIQVGRDPRGPDLLAEIAALSDCGSFRHIDALASGAPLLAFQRAIYNGPPPPRAAPTPRAITDLDRDGVDDRLDRCPKTPYGARVDVRGCWVIEDSVFETGSAHIRDDQLPTLEAVRSVMLGNPGLRIRLDGHTDDTGAADQNFELAERRASAVREFLAAGGVDVTRIEIRGFGPTRPIDRNDTVEGRSRNRRVEISVLDR